MIRRFVRDPVLGFHRQFLSGLGPRSLPNPRGKHVNQLINAPIETHVYFPPNAQPFTSANEPHCLCGIRYCHCQRDCCFTFSNFIPRSRRRPFAPHDISSEIILGREPAKVKPNLPQRLPIRVKPAGRKTGIVHLSTTNLKNNMTAIDRPPVKATVERNG